MTEYLGDRERPDEARREGKGEGGSACVFCLAVSMPCRRAVASKDTQPKPALLASLPAAAVGAALLEAIELWDGGKTGAQFNSKNSC